MVSLQLILSSPPVPSAVASFVFVLFVQQQLFSLEVAFVESAVASAPFWHVLGPYLSLASASRPLEQVYPIQ